jgi:hypothetical protein
MRKKELEYKALNALLQFKVTKKFCADYLNISEDTIERRLRDDHNMTFKEYHEFKMGRTAVGLQQKAIDMAMKGHPTMLIFALKNVAGWSDKIEQNVTSGSISIKIDKDDNNL